MAQESVTPHTPGGTPTQEHAQSGSKLGPILCWAVVFADIGTSIYYVPGILYGTVQGMAGFFVFLTMSVFVLLSLKYAEVTHRFPQGGGVVTVAARALNSWFGALGGMFILVDYFLTSAISCLSGMQYLSVVILPLGAAVALPGLGSFQLPILLATITILILLGILNWIGISESAKVSLVAALISFLSDIAVLVTVFSHISFAQFLDLIPQMFASHQLTFQSFLIGFAGSFLAFSGLESISQLSPVMKRPHKKVAGLALLLVVLTIGLTSPLLTMFSTLLLPSAAANEVKSSQLISLLAGNWGNMALQIEVAISASALLVFASNTAIIGAYHVFMALARMEFLPNIFMRRNRLRGTPHYSIAFATVIPIIVLILVRGNIVILGDMYAFGLLGAFTLTCLGMDIVRARDWRKARATNNNLIVTTDVENNNGQVRAEQADLERTTTSHDLQLSSTGASGLASQEVQSGRQEVKGLWFKVDFFLGILATFLVSVAWSTNLISKPLATAFGGGVTVIGMGVAYVNYRRTQKTGRVPVPVVSTRVEERLPNSVLAVLMAGNEHNDAVIHAAVNNAGPQNPLMFVYIGERKPRLAAPRVLEIVDPYLEDADAKECFGKAEDLALKAKIPTRRYVYLQGRPDMLPYIWQVVHPHDTIMASELSEQFNDINPDRIRYERTADGKVAHLLKSW